MAKTMTDYEKNLRTLATGMAEALAKKDVETANDLQHKLYNGLKKAEEGQVDEVWKIAATTVSAKAMGAISRYYKALKSMEYVAKDISNIL